MLWKKGHKPWNKGIATTIPRCKKCASFLAHGKKHLCRSVDLRKNRRCKICNRKLRYKGWERYSKICGSCGKTISREKERQLRKKLVKQFGSKCKKCGYRKVKDCLEFHHLDKAMKKRRYFIKDVLKYPEKFELLCNRCHREKEVVIAKKKRGNKNDSYTKEIRRRALLFR